jgi:predicted transcriptional regulator
METAVRRKRTSYELLADLLQSSKGGARKTALMFRANLSFLLLNKYLSVLLDNGFVEKRGSYYYPSHRGMIYLQKFSRYQRTKAEVMRTQEELGTILTFPRGEVGS